MATETTIRIADDDRRRLDALAEERGTTRSQIVREAVRGYLRDLERRERDERR